MGGGEVLRTCHAPRSTTRRGGSVVRYGRRRRSGFLISSFRVGGVLALAVNAGSVSLAVLIHGRRLLGHQTR